MARFYQTTEPKFVDFIYQPNYEMKMAVDETARRNVDLDRKLQSLDLAYKGALPGHEEAVLDKLQTFQTSLEELAKDFKSRKDDPEYQKKFKEFASAVKQEYTTGEIGKAAKHYESFVKQSEDWDTRIKDAKTQEEKAALERQKKMTDAYNLSRSSEFPIADYSLTDYTTPIDAQNLLQENIGDFKELTKESTDLLNNGLVDKIAKISTIKGYNPNVILPQYGKDGKLIQQTTPFDIAFSYLATDRDYIQYLKSIWEQSGISEARLESGEKAYEDFNAFAREEITKEAGNYAAKYPAITEESVKTGTQYTDMAELASVRSKLQEDRDKAKAKVAGDKKTQDEIEEFGATVPDFLQTYSDKEIEEFKKQYHKLAYKKNTAEGLSDEEKEIFEKFERRLETVAQTNREVLKEINTDLGYPYTGEESQEELDKINKVILANMINRNQEVEDYFRAKRGWVFPTPASDAFTEAQQKIIKTFKDSSTSEDLEILDKIFDNNYKKSRTFPGTPNNLYDRVEDYAKTYNKKIGKGIETVYKDMRNSYTGVVVDPNTKLGNLSLKALNAGLKSSTGASYFDPSTSVVDDNYKVRPSIENPLFTIENLVAKVSEDVRDAEGEDIPIDYTYLIENNYIKANHFKQADRHFADVEITPKGKKILGLDEDGPSKVIVGYAITPFDYDKEMIKLYNAAKTNEEKDILFSTFIQNDETSFRIQRTAEEYMSLSLKAQMSYKPIFPYISEGKVVFLQLILANAQEVEKGMEKPYYNLFQLKDDMKSLVQTMNKDGTVSAKPLNTLPIYSSNQLVRLLWTGE